MADKTADGEDSRKQYAKQLALKYYKAKEKQQTDGGDKAKEGEKKENAALDTLKHVGGKIYDSVMKASAPPSPQLNPQSSHAPQTQPSTSQQSRSYFDSSEGIQMESVDDGGDITPRNGSNTASSSSSNGTDSHRSTKNNGDARDNGEDHDPDYGDFNPNAVSNEQFMYAIKKRLVEAERTEKELEQVKNQLRDAQATSEQLVVKLGKDKEVIEQLKEEIKQLTKHNTRLVEILGNVSQTTQSRKEAPATRPSTTKTRVKN